MYIMQTRRNTKNRQKLSPLSEKQLLNRSPFSYAKYSVPKEERPDRNEDYTLVDQHRGLAAVFDGVGGSVAGDVASRVAARVVRRNWKRFLQTRQQGLEQPEMLEACNSEEVRSTLQQFLLDAHEEINADGVRRAKAKGEDAGKEVQATTIALAVFCRSSREDGYTMVYAWVGDSRIYLLRKSEKLMRLTTDDGWLAKMVKENTLSEAEALRIDQAMHADDLTEVEREHFDKRNGITQALGGSRPKDIHVGDVALLPGDRVLLCSDGVHDNLADVHIEDMLRYATRTTVANLLVESAIKGSHQTDGSIRAKPDDMSAVVVTYQG